MLWVLWGAIAVISCASICDISCTSICDIISPFTFACLHLHLHLPSLLLLPHIPPCHLSPLQSRHLALIVKLFEEHGSIDRSSHFGTYRVDLVVTLFSRVLDVHNFEVSARDRQRVCRYAEVQVCRCERVKRVWRACHRHI